MCDGDDLTIHIKHQTAFTTDVQFHAWFASNFMPFKGAMSRRVIAINLKHSIPAELLDASLDEMMVCGTAPMQLKCMMSYYSLLQEHERPVLNQVWPRYFQLQMIEMENNTQPICAFLRDLPNSSRTGWMVVPTTTPAQRAQRIKNYVPVSKIQYMFQRWCSTNGHRHTWDIILWQEACDMNNLWVRNKRLAWFPAADAEAEIIKRDYVFGILAPEQTGQPGAFGQTPESVEVDDLDEEMETEELDIQDAIHVNGTTLREAVYSSDPLGVMRGVNNVLDPEMIAWLWENAVNGRTGVMVAGEQNNMRTRMVAALVEMIQQSNLSQEVARQLEPRQVRRKRH